MVIALGSSSLLLGVIIGVIIVRLCRLNNSAKSHAPMAAVK